MDDGDIHKGEVVRKVKRRARERPRSGGSKKQGMPSLLAVEERKKEGEEEGNGEGTKESRDEGGRGRAGTRSGRRRARERQRGTEGRMGTPGSIEEDLGVSLLQEHRESERRAWEQEEGEKGGAEGGGT